MAGLRLCMVCKMLAPRGRMSAAASEIDRAVEGDTDVDAGVDVDAEDGECVVVETDTDTDSEERVDEDDEDEIADVVLRGGWGGNRCVVRSR